MIPLEKIAAQPRHLSATIPEAYLDVFGHMNIQYYFKLFNDSIFVMCAEMGMDEAYFRQQQRAMWALEQRLSRRGTHLNVSVILLSIPM